MNYKRRLPRRYDRCVLRTPRRLGNSMKDATRRMKLAAISKKETVIN